MWKRARMFVSVMLSASFIGGCAAHPDSVAPAYVSPLQYSNCDCDQIRMELMRVNAKVMEVAGVQEQTANKDSAAMAVGLILFWPALFFLASGDNRKEELARLKGEYDCLEGLAIQKHCEYAGDLVEARKKREEDARIKKAKDDAIPNFPAPPPHGTAEH